jgi:hypothetical protein
MACATAANDTLTIAKAAAMTRTPASMAPTPEPMPGPYVAGKAGRNRRGAPPAHPSRQFLQMFQ